jgi:outer membrane protein assembly factor BamB
MREIRGATLSIAALLLGTVSAAAADDAWWPQWRGPLGNGTAPHADPPVSWSETENVRFKVEVPGRGLASPVVWGDRIFLLTTVAADPPAQEGPRPPAAGGAAVAQPAAGEPAAGQPGVAQPEAPQPPAGQPTPGQPAGGEPAAGQPATGQPERRQRPPSVEPAEQRFVVLALDRNDGRVLWERTAARQVPHEGHHADASWASASPVTDGRRVFAHFGSNGLFAYTTDGDRLWQVDLGDMQTRNGFGEGSSPALWGDTLVVNWDHEGDSFLVALDAATGKERWRAARPGEPTSWSTPRIVTDLGRPQVVVAATGRSRGYDLETGEEIWSATGMTANTIPSPVYRDGVVYLTSGFRGNALQAIDLRRARGPVNDTEAMLWTHDLHTPYVPSAVLTDAGRLYFLKHVQNILSCLDAATGKVLYTEQRLEGIDGAWASPVAAAGRVYVAGRNGTTVVLEDGPEFKVLARNGLDDGFDASPAIAGDTIYLRGRRHLYALQRPPA